MRVMKSMAAACLLAAVLFLGIMNVGHATVVSLVGDRDCFGRGGSCPDGPTSDMTAFHDASDPAFMDTVTQAKDPTYNHVYDLAGATPVSASLEIKTGLLADNRGPWNVFYNGTQVGTFATHPGDYIVTYVFSIALGLLTGNDEVKLAINDPTVTDGYLIDYSALNIETAVPVATTPVPAALPLFLSALGLLGVSFWRGQRRGA